MLGSSMSLQMDLEIVILSEVSQRDKKKFYMISLICRIFFFKLDTNEFIFKTNTDSQT